MKQWILLILLSIGFLQPSAFAQQVFEEGIISYEVHILKNIKGNYKLVGTGTLTILQKGKNLSKEFSVGDAFNRTELFLNNGKEMYAISKNGKQKIARRIGQQRVQALLNKCPSLRITKADETTTVIAGYKAEKTNLQCSDSETPIELYATREWRINHPSIFENFPSFSFLPLSYEIQPDEETSLQFKLLEIKQVPLDNNIFRITKSYKIID